MPNPIPSHRAGQRHALASFGPYRDGRDVRLDNRC